MSPLPSTTFRSELDPIVRKELDQSHVEAAAYLLTEHDEDGHHTDITAKSITLIKQPATGATGNVTAPGAGPHVFGGPIKTTPYVDVNPVTAATGAAPGAFSKGDATGWADLHPNGRILIGHIGSTAGNGGVGPGVRLHGIPGGVRANDWAFIATQDNIGSCAALLHMGDSGVNVETPLKIRAQSALGNVFEILPNAVTNATRGVTLGSHAGGFTSGYEPFNEINVHEAYATNGYHERGRTLANGVWQTWPVVFNSSAMNAAQGDGTLSGTYCLIGKTLFFQIRFIWGSTTVPGTGIWGFQLPTAHPPYSPALTPFGLGTVWLYQNSSSKPFTGVAVNGLFFAGAFTGWTAVLVNAGNIYPYCPHLQPAVPFVWAAGDWMVVEGHYEIQ